jgi:hypothetical protein
MHFDIMYIHGWSTLLCNVRALFLCRIKLIFIYLTTKFYAMSAPKTFLHILTNDSMNPIVVSFIFFKFQILEITRSSPCFTLVVSMFYALFSC